MPAIKIKMRFDYKGQVKNSKLFGNKQPEQLAEENREHKVTMLRNIPMQGISIVDIDMSMDVYSVIDEISGKKIAFAPVVITLVADGLENAIRFAAQEEFRTVQVVEPDALNFTAGDTEKLLFRVSQEIMDFRNQWLKRMENWK